MSETSDENHAIYEAARETQVLDALNTLYVAMTRPEKELHIVSYEPKKISNTYADLFVEFVKTNMSLIKAVNIKAIIIELGANDGLRGINPSTTYSNLDQIIRKSKEFGLQVILTGMLAPPNLGPAYGDEFNRIYPDLAQKYDLIFFPFFLDGVVANPELNQEDGIHPNKYGVEVIAEKLNPYLRKLIGALRK